MILKKRKKEFAHQPWGNSFGDGWVLCHSDEQAHHNTEQGDTFHEGGGQDHVGTDVAGYFGLTGEGLESTLADFTDTDTCADGGEACADTSAHFTDACTSIRCCLQ